MACFNPNLACKYDMYASGEKARYRQHFDECLEDARDELRRLQLLHESVLWYNFEVGCKDLLIPTIDVGEWVYEYDCRLWSLRPKSARLVLQGHRVDYKWHRRKRHEMHVFPTWYFGPLREATQLPIELLDEEIRLAEAEVERCEKQLTASDDWAPGGVLYRELQAKTCVGNVLDS